MGPTDTDMILAIDENMPATACGDDVIWHHDVDHMISSPVQSS